MEERERRIGLNEALFREVNERLVDVNETFSGVSGVLEIVCECGDISCSEQLTIPQQDYEHLRSDPTWFAVVPGHEVARAELIIISRDGYDIVQKREGAAAAEAKATDPRG